MVAGNFCLASMVLPLGPLLLGKLLSTCWSVFLAPTLHGSFAIREAPVGVDWDAAAGRLPANPDVWTDGGLVLDEVSGAMLVCVLLPGTPQMGHF